MVPLRAIVPNKPRGVRQANDRRVLNSIFWVQVQVRDRTFSLDSMMFFAEA
jgi:hypothetical protein